MKRILTIGLFVSLLGLAACSSATPADLALQKMHDRVTEKIIQETKGFEPVNKAKTTMSADVSFSQFPETEFKGKADVSVKADMQQDMTNAKSPIMNLALALDLSVNETAGTLTGSPFKASLSTMLNARAVERTLLLNISKLLVNAEAFLPAPITLPDTMKDKWYGASFEEINRMIADQNKSTNATTPMIEDILANSFKGQPVTPAQLQKLWNDMHVWKGVEIVADAEHPELVRIRVESDKKKIQDSVRAFVRYIKDVSGPSWEAQLQANPQLREEIEKLEKDDAEFLKEMGTIKGVISADATTYDFREFEGEVFDETGKKTADVAASLSATNDMSLSITDTESKETITFEKKGDAVTLATTKGTVMSGTVSDKKVDLTFKDDETGVVDATVNLDIASVSKDGIKISKGTITLPAKKIIITVSSFEFALSNNMKNFLMQTAMSGTFEGKPFFTANVNSRREEIPSVSVTKPSFSTFEAFQQDFTSIFMQSMGDGAMAP